jgi:hypothetical protein
MIFRGLPLGVLEQLACARRLDRLADAELAPLLAAAAHARLFTGQLEAVEQDVRDAVAAADRVGDEASACFALLARTIWLRSRGLLDESLRTAEEAVARADNGPIEARHRHPRLFLAPARDRLRAGSPIAFCRQARSSPPISILGRSSR